MDSPHNQPLTVDEPKGPGVPRLMAWAALISGCACLVLPIILGLADALFGGLEEVIAYLVITGQVTAPAALMLGLLTLLLDWSDRTTRWIALIGALTGAIWVVIACAFFASGGWVPLSPC